MEAGTKLAQVLPELGVKVGGGLWKAVAAAPAGGPGVLLSPGPAVGQSYVCSGGERAGTSRSLPASLSLMGRLGGCFFQPTSGEVTCREGPRTTLGFEESCRIQVQKSRSGKWEGEPTHEKK